MTKPTGVLFDEAQALAKEGKYEEALQTLLHYWEASRITEGEGGVRLSFVLSFWMELAKVHANAKSSLLSIRDIYEKRLLLGGGDFDTFHEYRSINERFGEDSKTVATFKTIYERYPELARQTVFAVLDLLAKHHEYELWSRHTPEPQISFNRLREHRELFLEWARKEQDAEKTAFILQFADERFENDTRQLIEILVGAGRPSEADAIHSAAISTLDTPSIRSALEDAEARVKAARR